MNKRLPLVLTTGLILAMSAIVVPFKQSAYTSRPDQRQPSQQNSKLVGLYGEDLGEESFGALGGTPSSAFGGINTIAPVSKGIYEITLANTGTAWEETFLLGIPEGPLQVAPLLVLFHGYGEKPRDILENTELFERARARGWYVVAPMAAHQYNFGIEYAQQNVDVALNWVARHLPLDIHRLYAVGFSMGGGLATSYAARHQNIYGGRFAAVVNHTGVTSLSHSFRMSNDNRLFLSPLMFGVTPDQNPFVYSSVSSYDLDPVSGAINQETDMLRNLTSTPVRIFAAAQEPLSILVTQTNQFEAQLALRGGMGDSLRGPSAVHAWSTMDAKATLDWLATKTVAPPAWGETHELLADRNGRWHGFYLYQRQVQVLTPLTYQVQPALNRLFTIGAKNLERISVYPRSIGLRTSTEFTWVFGTLENGPVELSMRGITHIPHNVRRNGVSTIDWEYDPKTRQIELFESGGAGVSTWTVEF